MQATEQFDYEDFSAKKVANKTFLNKNVIQKGNINLSGVEKRSGTHTLL